MDEATIVTYASAPNLRIPAADGDSDPMILPKYSYLIAGLLPNATIKIYEDAAHGFLFPHHERFASDVIAFLDAE